MNKPFHLLINKLIADSTLIKDVCTIIAEFLHCNDAYLMESNRCMSPCPRTIVSSFYCRYHWIKPTCSIEDVLYKTKGGSIKIVVETPLNFAFGITRDNYNGPKVCSDKVTRKTKLFHVNLDFIHPEIKRCYKFFDAPFTRENKKIIIEFCVQSDAGATATIPGTNWSRYINLKPNLKKAKLKDYFFFVILDHYSTATLIFT